MFDDFIPFRFLPESIRSDLAKHVISREFAPPELVLHPGNDDKSVMLLVQGEVEVFDPVHDRVVGRIHAGHYFGERASLFSEPRSYAVRASKPCRVLCISGERFLQLLGESAVFAQGMATILRHKQGIFAPFERFMAELLRALGSGEVLIGKLLPLYQDLDPALHPGARSPDVNLSALSYSVRRLPDNVARCFAYYVTEALPDHQDRPEELFAEIGTAARRRAVFELMPGKNLVLIRDGISDVVDFITCLCLYVCETRKLRRRMLDRDLLSALIRGDESFPLPFTADEIVELERIWPVRMRDRLRDVLLHHEDQYISVFRQLNNYNSAHAEAWTHHIATRTRELLGTDPALLPDDLPVHIISSNTHSVHNCLSPWLGANRDVILEWAHATHHSLVNERWFNQTDAVYAIARDYLRAHPRSAEEKIAADAEAGILVLTETGFTGIEVELVDTDRLRTGTALDPLLGSLAPGLLINIDYAFGQQAEHIIGNLVALFGRRIRSINVLGKAGALVGKRGDILAATGFIEQHQDIFQPIVNNATDLDHLRTLTDRDVHVGPVLTVGGTLLQNRRMLHFNKHVWGCIGLEMEGTYYLAQILESMHRGILRPDLDLRFLYYVSDLPLDHTANLSGALQATEGIPPLYAITREILHATLADPR